MILRGCDRYSLGAALLCRDPSLITFQSWRLVPIKLVAGRSCLACIIVSVCLALGRRQVRRVSRLVKLICANLAHWSIL